MLLELYCSSFPAVAAGTCDWPVTDFLGNKDELLEWTVPGFKCDKKKKGKHGKYRVEIHNGKYST